MPVRSRHSTLVPALVAAALCLSGLVTATTAQAGTPLDRLGCSVASRTGPVRLDDALDSRLSATRVRDANALTGGELLHLAEDATSWVDACGRVFVVDDAASEQQLEAVVDVAPAAGVQEDVFDLSSRPDSDRTIYLDFDGATHSGTGWRNGETIVSPAYSVDGDRTAFTETERAQIQLAWQVVAEDFAPFDVNITTRQPAPSALTRTSRLDPTYGMAVVVTPANSVGAGCSCGGMAYVGVLGNPDANAYQPAWVFTSGSGIGGYNMGQAISHEVGHTFGLVHDGTPEADYYRGAEGWAPIMGSAYNRRASQWSQGEYPGADNAEDDVATIAALAPVLVDDHADGVAGATPITLEDPATGVLTTRADVDAFAFVASGATSLTAAGPLGLGNADLALTILDAGGSVVASVDTVADTASDTSMSAAWNAVLPGAPAAYTALVTGTGSGDPGQEGGYSDYGSLGAYTVTLSRPANTQPSQPSQPSTPTTPTTPTTQSAPAVTATPSAPAVTATPSEPAPALAFVTTSLPTARVGRTYRAEILFTGAVTEARVDRRLPRGLRWRVGPGRIVITGKVRTREVARFASVLSGEDSSVRRRFLLRTL